MSQIQPDMSEKENKRLKVITDYQTMAERAAKAERSGNFNQASVLWHETWLLARSPANGKWCEVNSPKFGAIHTIHPVDEKLVYISKSMIKNN